MKRPGALSPEEAALWRRIADTVRPLERRSIPPRSALPDTEKTPAQPAASRAVPPAAAIPSRSTTALPAPRGSPERTGLDAGWEHRLARGLVEPDFVLDLHGASLDAAHARLDHGLVQAKAVGARVVLLITGKPRPVDPADRSHRRGAIRAKVGDWIAAGSRGQDIAAIRTAHRRHGGPGALYLILKRRRSPRK